MSEAAGLSINSKNSLFQSLVMSFFSKIQRGCLSFSDGGSTKIFGDASDVLRAELTVLSDDFYDRIFWNGSIGFAEGYILGSWSTDNLTKLLQIITINIDIVDKIDQAFWGTVLRGFSNIMHYLRKNSISGARKNIAQHYDLGNNFFNLFLDSSMMYSAAKFDDINVTLELASRNKLQLICEKLQLKASDHVLEIGTGWGGFAIYAALNFGCKVTTTTISKEQFDYVNEKISKLNLKSQITLLMQDYRDLTGKYDKLVSIEMIEAVGHNYLGTYINMCSNLLKQDGVFVLQAITITEQRYMAARNSVDFIKKYIFPGGFLPAIGEIMRYLRSDSDLNLLDLEDLTLDYAKTLRVWREGFMANYNKIVGQGFDELFMRKWQYYFSYCEAGFRERYIGCAQLVLSKPEYRD